MIALQLRALALAAVLAAATPAAVRASDDVPLPSRVTISAAPAGAPAEFGAYLGRWTGRWDGVLPSVLIVEEVDLEGRAVVIYAWGDDAAGRFRKGWTRVPGTIARSELALAPFPNGALLQFRLTPDGTLSGTYTLPNGVSRISMRRLP